MFSLNNRFLLGILTVACSIYLVYPKTVKQYGLLKRPIRSPGECVGGCDGSFITNYQTFHGEVAFNSFFNSSGGELPCNDTAQNTPAINDGVSKRRILRPKPKLNNLPGYRKTGRTSLPREPDSNNKPNAKQMGRRLANSKHNHPEYVKHPSTGK